MAPPPVSARTYTPVGSRFTADLSGIPEVVQIILSLLEIGQAPQPSLNSPTPEIKACFW